MKHPNEYEKRYQKQRALEEIRTRLATQLPGVMFGTLASIMLFSFGLGWAYEVLAGWSEHLEWAAGALVAAGLLFWVVSHVAWGMKSDAEIERKLEQELAR